jgi:uncharacterized protein YndB with AHSA1/START domain
MADGNTLGAGYEMTINRTFNAPAALVFDCFTDPVHFAKWWGPLGCRSEVYTLDARPGGEISLRMAGPGYDHVMGGEFLEIDRPSRLVFRAKAFKDESGEWCMIHRTTLTFNEHDGRTAMTLHTVVERAQGELVLGALGGMKAGWGQSLERLGDLVGGGGKMDIEISDRRIVVARAFDTSPEKLWRALTEADLFAQWWSGGGGVVEAMDVRPGGKWSLRQTGQDGLEHRFWGEFKQIEPPARLVMTQGFDAHEAVDVTVVLTSEWGRAKLTRTMIFPSNAYRDGVLGSGFEPHTALSYDLLAKVAAA